MKMSKKEKTIRNYPTISPEDESSGMNLKNNDSKKRKIKEPGEYSFHSFKDFLKKQNTSIKENLAQKTSWKQPGMGKQTLGSEYSSNNAYKEDPIHNLDTDVLDKMLSREDKNILTKISKNYDMTYDEILNFIASKDITLEDFLSRFKGE